MPGSLGLIPSAIKSAFMKFEGILWLINLLPYQLSQNITLAEVLQKAQRNA